MGAIPNKNDKKAPKQGHIRAFERFFLKKQGAIPNKNDKKTPKQRIFRALERFF